MPNITDHGDIRTVGKQVRDARRKQGLTQAELAQLANLARPTISLLENGLATELGFNKVVSLLKVLGLGIQITSLERAPKSDLLRIAATAASVSFKEPIEEAALMHALLTGKVPNGKRPHLRALLQDADEALVKGLIRDLRQHTPPGRIERGIAQLAQTLKIERDLAPWLKSE